MKKALFFTRESTLAMAVFLAIGFAAISYATPTWMWIGTYYITLDETPPGTSEPLGLQPHADNFFNGARDHHWGGPAPVRHVNAPGKQANRTALTTAPERELCDFLFLAFHGTKRQMNIWDDLGKWAYAYKPPDYHFGTNYVRWVWCQSCSVLVYDYPDFWSGWDPAFKGVQAILGYGTPVGAGNVRNVPLYFWENWAHETYQMTMWDAFYEAARRGIYQEGGSSGLPTIISSCRPSDPSHYYLDDTYNLATSEKGVEDPRCCRMGYVGP